MTKHDEWAMQHNPQNEHEDPYFKKEGQCQYNTCDQQAMDDQRYCERCEIKSRNGEILSHINKNLMKDNGIEVLTPEEILEQGVLLTQCDFKPTHFKYWIGQYFYIMELQEVE